MHRAVCKFSAFNRVKLGQLLFSSFKTFDCSNEALKEIKTSFDENHFKIEVACLKNGSKKYPYIWLRDYCRCGKCYDVVNNQTLVNLRDVPLDVKPKEISDLSNTTFNITWSDGHSSAYDLKELAEFAFESDLKKSERTYWSKGTIKDKLSGLRFNFNDYLKNDEVLKESLQALNKYGFMIVNNIPLPIDNSVKAIERISPIQKTIYGEVTILTANGEREDSAYSNVGLKAHHDCTYLKNTPGLEIFQLMKHDGAGGETLLVDGFHCANLLRDLHPDDFEALTRINVRAVFKEKGKYEISHIDPVIKLNPADSSFLQIRYNSYDRGVLNYLSYEETLSYYKAIRNYAKIIENKDNELWFQLKQGELLFFDNFRVMHGRSSFNGERQLMTVYAPRDEWISKATVLNKK